MSECTERVEGHGARAGPAARSRLSRAHRRSTPPQTMLLINSYLSLGICRSAPTNWDKLFKFGQRMSAECQSAWKEPEKLCFQYTDAMCVIRSISAELRRVRSGRCERWKAKPVEARRWQVRARRRYVRRFSSLKLSELTRGGVRVCWCRVENSLKALSQVRAHLAHACSTSYL